MGIVNENHCIKCNKRVEAEKDKIDKAALAFETGIN